MYSGLSVMLMSLELTVFNQHTALKAPNIGLYNTSAMAFNIFEGVTQLERLIFVACMEEWSEIICHLTNLKVVKKLFLQVSHLGILKHPNGSSLY